MGNADDPTLDQNKKRDQDEMALRGGVADVTLAWATVENSLMSLLDFIVNERKTLALRQIVSAMYFSLTNLESKFRMVDTALKQFVHGHPAEAEFLAVWHGTVENRFTRLKATRNAVAHGQIVAIRNRARLTAPIFDFAPSRQVRKGHQLPGMGPDELRQSAEAAEVLCERIISCAVLVKFVRDPAQLATLRRRLAQLSRSDRP
jgi:hypothetical protein